MITVITRLRIHMRVPFGLVALDKSRRRTQRSLRKITAKFQLQRLAGEVIFLRRLIEAYEKKIYAKTATAQLI